MLGGGCHCGCGDIPNFVDEITFRQFCEYPMTECTYSFDFFSYVFPTLPFAITSTFMISRATIVLRHARLLLPPVGAFELVLSVGNRGRLSSQATLGCREWVFPTRGFLYVYSVLILFFSSFP